MFVTYLKKSMPGTGTKLAHTAGEGPAEVTELDCGWHRPAAPFSESLLEA